MIISTNFHIFFLISCESVLYLNNLNILIEKISIIVQLPIFRFRRTCESPERTKLNDLRSRQFQIRQMKIYRWINYEEKNQMMLKNC